MSKQIKANLILHQEYVDFLDDTAFKLLKKKRKRVSSSLLVRCCIHYFGKLTESEQLREIEKQVAKEKPNG